MDGGWGGLWSVITEQVKAFPQGVGLLVGLSVYQVVFYLLAVTGIVATLRGTSGPGKWVAVVMTLAIILLLLTPGQGGHERFRVPVQPLLAILAGYGMGARAPMQEPVL
jgi:hypothetical protein